MTEKTLLIDDLTPDNLEFLAGGEVILARGRKYFAEGRVELRRLGPDSAEATVRGTRRYEVTIKRNEDGPFADCTCPFNAEWGACKHGAAAALALVAAARRGGLPVAMEPAPAALLRSRGRLRLVPSTPVEKEPEPPEYPPDFASLPIAALFVPPEVPTIFAGDHLPEPLREPLAAAGVMALPLSRVLQGALARTSLSPKLVAEVLRIAERWARQAERARSLYFFLDRGSHELTSLHAALLGLARNPGARYRLPSEAERELQFERADLPVTAVYREKRPCLSPEGTLVAPEVRLVLELQGPLSWRCTCRPGEAHPVCVHALAAAGSLLEWMEALPPASAERVLMQRDWEALLDGLAVATAGSRRSSGRLLRFHLDLDPSGQPRAVRALLHPVRQKGKLGGGKPLTSAALEEMLADLSTQDARVAELLCDRRGHQPFLTPRLYRILDLLAGSDRLHHQDAPIAVHKRKLQLELQGPPEGPVVLRATCAGSSLDPAVLFRLLHSSAPALAFFDAKARALELIERPGLPLTTLELLCGAGTALPSSAITQVAEKLPALERAFELAIPDWMQGEEVAAGQHVVLRLQRRQGPGLTGVFLLEPLETRSPVPLASPPETLTHWRDGRRLVVRRNPAWETARLATLQAELGLSPASGGEPPSAEFVLDEDAAALALLERLSAEPPAGLAVEWVERPLRIRRLDGLGKLDLKVTSAGEWFGLSGAIDELELASVLDALRRDLPYVRSGDELVRLTDSVRASLLPLASLSEVTQKGVEVSPASLPLLLALADEGVSVDLSAELRRREKKLRAAERLAPELPRGLKAELRPYQRTGFEWMARLAAWGGGGCLADDMGLGKTVQTLALLAHRAEEGPALITAPTSVCFNWLREAARFTPGLVLHAYSEADRAALIDGLKPGEVVVVSHALLTRDIERFAGRKWATLVVDEAQAFKNVDTHRARALTRLEAEARFALTGTPVENRLDELWSHFRWLFPGLLGSREGFQKRFAQPIERAASPAHKAGLARLIRPFSLRRTKADVAPELPARTEIVESVELAPAERKLYEDARKAALAELSATSGTGTGAKGKAERRRFEVLAALTRLRQLACHPRLVDPGWKGDSAKLERLASLVGELSGQGHKVLVFSQFTRHLDLAQAALSRGGHTLLRIDGSTPAAARQEAVERFQAGEADCLLISLKAGGFGLNLTAASYVLHLDPWWNPAAEDQASDRAHRIGQDKPVTVVRLVTRDTIEERILTLHGKKRELVRGLLDDADKPVRFSVESLTELLTDAA